MFTAPDNAIGEPAPVAVPKSRRRAETWRRALAALLSAGVVLVLLAAAGVREDQRAFARLTNPIDRFALDALVKGRRALAPRPVPNDPVVIGIDEDTHAAMPEPYALWHRRLGLLIASLTRSDAAAFGVGVGLPDRLYDALTPGIDQALLGPIAEARGRLPLVFARAVETSGVLRYPHPAYVAAAGGAERFAHLALDSDADGVVRNFADRACATEPANCTFAGALAAALGARQGWSGYIPYDLGPSIDYLPMHEVLQWAERGDQARLRAAFARKVVLLGVVLPAENRVGAPVALAAREPRSTRVPAIMAHAQVLRGLLNAGLLAPAPGWLVAALGLLAALCALGRAARSRLLAVAAYLCLIIAASVFAWGRGLVLPAGSLMLAGVAAAVIGALLDRLAAFLALHRLQRAFEGVLAPELVHSIESGETDIGTGARRGEVAVLVCHLGDVAERAALAPPVETGLLMDAQLARIEGAVRAHDGRVEAFAADTVLASFGAPLATRSPARAALEAAQEIFAGIARLREEFAAEALPVAPITIGIASGIALVGRLGVPGRADWHVLGDIVDVARALQAQASRANSPVLCSEAVAAAVGYPPVLARVAMPDGSLAFAWDPETRAHFERTGATGRTSATARGARERTS